MSLRGFGFTVDLKTGLHLYWYIDKNGIKRWINTDLQVDDIETVATPLSEQTE